MTSVLFTRSFRLALASRSSSCAPSRIETGMWDSLRSILYHSVARVGRLPRLESCPEQPEEALRSRGQLGDLDPERSEGVRHRVGDGGGGADGSALADTLEAAEGGRRRLLEVQHLDPRQLGRGGDQVVHQASRQELAAVAVHEL